MALTLLFITVMTLVPLLAARRLPNSNLWDRSMLQSAKPSGWYANLWLWWVLLGMILVGIYWKFW
jgi:hypothetical protein